jgi:Alkylmercury lyase
VTEELSRDVQRSVGVSPRHYETLGELVKGIAAEHWVQEPANLISEEPTRHEVRVDGRVLHTFCFVDALMLPFVLEEGAIEVRSDSPNGGEVSVFVTEEAWKVRHQGRSSRSARPGQRKGRSARRYALT